MCKISRNYAHYLIASLKIEAPPLHKKALINFNTSIKISSIITLLHSPQLMASVDAPSSCRLSWPIHGEFSKVYPSTCRWNKLLDRVRG
jgi:hypothetical protein